MRQYLFMLSHKMIQHQKIKTLAFHSSVTKRHWTKITASVLRLWMVSCAVNMLSPLVKLRLANDTFCKISAFNYPFQSNQNPTYLEDLRCTKHMSYYYEQQPAFEHFPLCPHHCISTQTYKSACVPPCLLLEELIVQKSVWIWKLEITTELWAKKDRFHSLVISGVSLYMFLQIQNPDS